MNRAEIVGLFTAIKILAKADDIKGIKKIVNAVLDELHDHSKDQKSKEDNN